MGSETSDLISKTLGGDLCDLRKDLLVDVEVVGQLVIVLLEKHLCGTLDCIGSDSAHGSK